jgi:hypothetical protein
MKIDTVLTVVAASLAFLFADLSLSPKSYRWEVTHGQVWGGDEDCDDCGEYGGFIGCILATAGGEIKCFKNDGETLGRTCEQVECEPVDDDHQCPHANLRKYRDGHKRKTVYQGQAVGVRPCFKPDDEDGWTFCHCEPGGGAAEAAGSKKELKEDVPCFDIISCFTSVGDCVPHPTLNKMVCVLSGTSTEGSAPHVTPHPQFPCPTKDQVDKLVKDCEDQYK